MKGIVKIYVSVFVLASMFTLYSVTYAADVNIKLGTTGDAFRVKDPSNASLMAVLGSGNVGIGTTSPSRNLHVSGITESNRFVVSNSVNSTEGLWMYGGDSSWGMYLAKAGPGNALGGTTSVAGHFGSDWAYRFRASSNTEADQGFIFENSDNTLLMSIRGSNGEVYHAGNVGIGTTVPNVSLDVIGDIEYTGSITQISDERLKDNIQLIDGALEKIQAVNGVYYNMADTPERKEIGVIAQNVQDVLPEAVKVVDPENGYLGVSYTGLVPVLIEAIKELKAENDALKQEVNIVKAENVQLKENLLALAKRQDDIESIVLAMTTIENGKLAKLSDTD